MLRVKIWSNLIGNYKQFIRERVRCSESNWILLMYGKKSTQKGDSDYWKKTGAGVREQLKDSWVNAA